MGEFATGARPEPHPHIGECRPCFPKIDFVLQFLTFRQHAIPHSRDACVRPLFAGARLRAMASRLDHALRPLACRQAPAYEQGGHCPPWDIRAHMTLAWRTVPALPA